ncbi:MAG: class I SAM-dependent methyltransferase [Polyangiales bacterium]
MSNDSAAEKTVGNPRGADEIPVDQFAKVGVGEYYGQQRGEILERVPRTTKRLLDVGCANGAFGKTVKDSLGAEVWGIEILAPAAEVAATRLDRVLNTDANAALAQLPLQHFDCITFNDVLEHLVDPGALLRDIKKHVAPGGVLVASIPNVRQYQVLFDLAVKGNFDYADSGILDRTHLRFFTLKSIRKFFDSAGYRIVSVEGINGPHSRFGRVVGKLLPPGLSDLQYIQFVVVARPV